MRIAIFGATLFFMSAAVAQKSTDSTGEFTMDLGQVYGAVRAVKSMEEICSKDFPNTRESNQRAYEDWRRKYLPFTQEMERHFSAMTWRESKQDPQQHMAVLAKFDKAFEGYKQGLRQQLASDGPEAFRKQCEIYPAYLKSPRMNLESFYAEQVATVRRGPK